MKAPLILILLLTVASCRLSDAKLAILCNQKFPPKIDSSEVKIGKITQSFDTVKTLPFVIKFIYPFECPASDRPLVINFPVETTCPPCEKITKTIERTDTIKIKLEDTAKLQAARDSTSTAVKNSEKSDKRGDKWMWIALCSIGVNLLFFLSYIYV